MKSWIRDARSQGMEPTGVDAVPAGTVAVLRDTPHGLEVLLARRGSTLEFHGGAWVFPGGRVDPDDYGDEPDDLDRAVARAAARETQEEAGIGLEAESLVYLSHWTTPDISPKRFATWFFVATTADDHGVADGGETTELRWFRPRDALAEREAGEIELAPPQFVTLLVLDQYDTAEAALAGVESGDAMAVTPRFAFLDDGAAVCVYDDDVAYDDLDLDRPGPRHRLVMGTDNRWTYERD